MFREECEGFAKLQTELNKEFNENTSPAALIDIVHSLIGKKLTFFHNSNTNHYID